MPTPNKKRFAHILLQAVAAGCLLPAAAFAEVLPDNTTGWAAGAAAVGAVDDATAVPIVVHLAVRDPAALKRLADAVSTPGSAQYGQYLTAKQFASRFAPAASDIAAVKSLLSGAGMTGITVGSAGTYVSAMATVKQLRQAFGVTQALYRYHGRSVRANSEAPTVPAALSGKIIAIEGLTDLTQIRHPDHVSVTQDALVAPARTAVAAAMSAAADAGTVTPPPVAAENPSSYCDTFVGDLRATMSTAPAPYAQLEPWLVCGYTPQQIQSAYGLNPLNIGLNGAGVTVAIVDAFASPTLQADGNRYAANHGLPALTGTNFSEVIPAGIYDVPSAQVSNAYGWWGEQSLDVAAVHGSAPGATIVYVGSTDNGTSLTTALIDTINDHRADIITNSWGDNGDGDTAAQVAAYDQAFESAAAMGITVLFSSGDDGDLSQINVVASSSQPGDSPYATDVGGTSLLLRNAGGTKSEYGWGNYRAFLANATVNSATSITTSGLTQTTAYGVTFPAFSFYAGSGGGASVVEAQPAYQKGVVPKALSTVFNSAQGYEIPTTKRRVSPDISAVGDPYTGYLYGETFTIDTGSAASVTNTGCTALTATTEYCEGSIGGTSLASPVTAGMFATLDQIRGLSGRSFVGFANPFLYGLKVGKTTNSAGINQVLAPTVPSALLRGYKSNPNEVRVVTLNSVPENILSSPYPIEVCSSDICQGIDDVFNYTTAGYNDVTGLGVPYLPLLALE